MFLALTAFAAFLTKTSLVLAAVPVVNINNGSVVGIDIAGFNQHAFLGIPYAQPPVGDLRLRRPRPYNQTFDNFEATDYSPLCWNVATTGSSDGAGLPQDEDCLTINIVRPADASPEELLPVMFWIHGGGWSAGGSGIDWYNGTYLVEASTNYSNPIVYVSINYRLSQLGFLAGKELADEGNLNLGYYDQRLALHWVQENIAAFGGDPEKVTIFGESAGGFAVGTHFTAFGGRDDNLFRAGISQSGTVSSYPLPTDARFQNSYDQLVANTTCKEFTTAESQLDCLRRIPVDEFRLAVRSWSTGTVVDGDLIPLSVANAMDAYNNGLYVKKPLITGTTTDEGSGSARSEEQVVTMLENMGFNATQVERMLELYPSDARLGVPYNTGMYMPNGTPYSKQAASIAGDTTFIALRRWVAEELVKVEIPVWTYRFNQNPAFIDNPNGGSPHFAEIFYLFGNPNCPLQIGRCLGDLAYDHALSDVLQSMWIAFAVHLDPNQNNYPGAPYWPAYSEGAENMRFQGGGSSAEKDDCRKEGIQFLIDNYFPNQGGSRQ